MISKSKNNKLILSTIFIFYFAFSVSVPAFQQENQQESTSTENFTIPSESWFIKYGSPALLSLAVALISFFLTQLFFRHKDQNNKKGDYCSVLKIIAGEIKRNINFECQLHAYFFVNIMPTFGLSFFASEYYFKELSSVYLNHSLISRIFNNYFEYYHIQNRIDRTINLTHEIFQTSNSTIGDISQRRAASMKYNNERNDTSELIRINIRVSLDLYNDICKEIKKFCKDSEFEELPLEYLDKKYDYFQYVGEVVQAASKQQIKLANRNKYY